MGVVEMVSWLAVGVVLGSVYGGLLCFPVLVVLWFVVVGGRGGGGRGGVGHVRRCRGVLPGRLGLRAAVCGRRADARANGRGCRPVAGGRPEPVAVCPWPCQPVVGRCTLCCDLGCPSVLGARRVAHR